MFGQHGVTSQFLSPAYVVELNGCMAPLKFVLSSAGYSVTIDVFKTRTRNVGSLLPRHLARPERRKNNLQNCFASPPFASFHVRV